MKSEVCSPSIARSLQRRLQSTRSRHSGAQTAVFHLCMSCLNQLSYNSPEIVAVKADSPSQLGPTGTLQVIDCYRRASHGVVHPLALTTLPECAHPKSSAGRSKQFRAGLARDACPNPQHTILRKQARRPPREQLQMWLMSNASTKTTKPHAAPSRSHSPGLLVTVRV